MTHIVAELEHRHAGRGWQPSSEVAEASVMLDLFQGLGVQCFSLTFTDDTGRKIAFKRIGPLNCCAVNCRLYYSPPARKG
jgi:hypothetical protein